MKDHNYFNGKIIVIGINNERNSISNIIIIYKIIEHLIARINSIYIYIYICIISFVQGRFGSSHTPVPYVL